MDPSVNCTIRRKRHVGVLLALALLTGFLMLSKPLAEAGSIDFSQCRNDADNNNVKDNCAWTSGGINSNNSIYAEGGAVPQRLFIQIDTAGAHTLRFTYDFSKASVYAYDFLTSAKAGPQTDDTLLNPCADLPSFVDSTTCNTLYTGVGTTAIPSDPFDGVSTRETAGRNFLINCSPACSGIALSFPSLDGGDDPGEAHVPDSDPDCFQTCGTSAVSIDLALTTASNNTLVAVWFAGHLSKGTGTGGWGDGFGGSSISGAPFAIQLVSLDGGSVGNRTNQFQGGILAPPPAAGSITVQKVVLGNPPASDWAFSMTGQSPFTLPAKGGQTTISSLTPGSYTISETTKPDYIASVVCTDGTTGTSSVTVTLTEAGGISCLFTNELPPANVPTLDEWGMIGMALLLAGVAIWYLRRRPAQIA